MRKASVAVLCAVWLIGCHSGSAPVVATNAPPPTAPAPNPPAVDKPVTSPETTEPAQKPPTEPTQPPAAPEKPKAPSLPDNLKTPAYDYEGLGAGKPVDYEILGDPSQGTLTGSVTTSLKEVKDGAAYFDQVYSGGLSRLGSNQLSLDDKGVHVVKSSLEEVEPGNIEFPSDVSPGFSWKSHERTTDPAVSADLTTTYTIKGVKSVQTKRGTLQALEITSISQGTRSGQKLSMESESYYVKGIGLAKAVIKTKGADGKTETMIQQLAD